MIITCLSPDKLTPLWTKLQLESALEAEELPEWVRGSYEAFTTVVRGEGFPCFFGSLAEQKEMIRYAIAPSSTNRESLEHLLEAIYAYLEAESTREEEKTLEEDSLLLTLAIFFPWEEGEYPIEHYIEQAYTVLNGLHQYDRVPWPADIPSDPTDIDWRYCLGGQSLFINVSTPANQKRRSRNLGPGLTMIVNPDNIFERVRQLWGEEPRRNIYKRMETYDLVPIYPLLQPWDSEEEREYCTTQVTAIGDRNDRQYPFPFRYNPSNQQQGKCPFRSSSSSSKLSQ